MTTGETIISTAQEVEAYLTSALVRIDNLKKKPMSQFDYEQAEAATEIHGAIKANRELMKYAAALDDETDKEEPLTLDAAYKEFREQLQGLKEDFERFKNGHI